MVTLTLVKRDVEAAAAQAALYELNPKFDAAAFTAKLRRRSVNPVYQDQLERIIAMLQRWRGEPDGREKDR
jgi:hypothetical protein